jgi:hypothetical protein
MNLKNKPKIDYDMQLKKIKGLSAHALIKWIRRVGLISFLKKKKIVFLSDFFI